LNGHSSVTAVATAAAIIDPYYIKNSIPAIPAIPAGNTTFIVDGAIAVEAQLKCRTPVTADARASFYIIAAAVATRASADGRRRGDANRGPGSQ
jgi:hypothetical protein